MALDGLNSGEIAQAYFAEYNEKYRSKEVLDGLKEATQEAKDFLNQRNMRYVEGTGEEDRNTPFLTDEAIEVLSDKSTSYFRKAVNQRLAFELVFTNSLFKALHHLEDIGILSDGFMLLSNETFRCDRVHKFMTSVELRRQSPTASSVFTLKEAVKIFYSSSDSWATKKVRDRLVDLAATGLIMGSYADGEGYTFRPGPLLKSLSEGAIEPFLETLYD